MSEGRCIDKFNKEKLGLYKIALDRYNELHQRYDIHIVKDENDEESYKLISDNQASLFCDIYEELKTQATLIEYVLKKNGVI